MRQLLQGHPNGTFLADALPDTQLLNAGILYISKDYELAVFNEIGAELIGKPQAAGTVIHLDKIFTPNSDEYHVFQHVAATECEYRDAVFKWEVAGSVRHVLLDSFVHQAPEGAVLGMYVVMKDMGNFSTLEQQTQRAEKMATVGKLAAGIAHEIRNPLTTVKGFLQVLENRFQVGLMDEEVQYVQVMMSEIERVNALVAELLLLSKPHNLDWSTFHFSDVIDEIQPWIDSKVQGQGVECQVDIAEGLMMTADRDMIRQLMLHLVKNAIEAVDAGGIVSIQGKLKDEKVQISISDTGPGIPYYLVDKIFDAFYTTKAQGTGLGLAICQRIVADHGGQIRVSSKGFGTSFTVSLPVSRTQHAANLLSQATTIPLFS